MWFLWTHLSLALAGRKDLNSRVVLDRVWFGVSAGRLWLCHGALEEGVAVGVGVLGGTDVGVEGVCGRADGQLLWSHWLGCRHDKTMKCRTWLFTVSLNRK